MARSSSLAEHYRAHREAFLLALELGCTPREAECELRRRAAEADRAAARQRWAETEARLIAKMAAPLPRAISAPIQSEPADPPWMMRD